MGQGYLVDTNIIIYEFQDSFPPECVETVDKIFFEKIQNLKLYNPFKPI